MRARENQEAVVGEMRGAGRGGELEGERVSWTIDLQRRGRRREESVRHTRGGEEGEDGKKR